MNRSALCWGMVVLLWMIGGCTTPFVLVPSHTAGSTTGLRPPAHANNPAAAEKPAKAPETGWTERVITEDELSDLYVKDPQLPPAEVKRILSRLNIRDSYLIGEDIRQGRPMRVPDDFRAYRGWSPLPEWQAELKHWPKSILVVKNLCFLGWYEKGQQVGNTMVCLGVRGQETHSGIFGVLEKDPEHYSKSYKNSYGEAAWMPWALRIYEAVWIHAGDITDRLCSHGCVSLPMEEAESLFQWTDVGTPVVIVESLDEVRSALKGAN